MITAAKVQEASRAFCRSVDDLGPIPADLCAGCPGVEGGCMEDPVECGRLRRED